MSLNTDINAAAWSVGSLALGGVSGALLDATMSKVLDKQLVHSSAANRAALRFVLQGGVGVVLLGGVLRSFIPAGVETPIGDAPVWFAFLYAQQDFLADFFVLQQLIVSYIFGHDTHHRPHKHPSVHRPTNPIVTGDDSAAISATGNVSYGMSAIQSQSEMPAMGIHSNYMGRELNIK